MHSAFDEMITLWFATRTPGQNPSMMSHSRHLRFFALSGEALLNTLEAAHHLPCILNWLYEKIALW